MAKNKSSIVKLGVFIIVALLLFTYGIYKVSDHQAFFNNTLDLFVDFSDVNGLRPGNNVRFSGIIIGSVENISILNDTTLRVKMAVEQSANKYLRNNALAEISTDGLVGNMVINISPKKAQAALIKNGDIIRARPKVEINEVLNILSETNSKIAAITGQLLEVSEKINNGQGSISLLVNDEKMATNLKASIQNLESASSKMNTAGHELSQMMNQVSKGEGNLGYLLRDTSLKSQVEYLSKNLDTLLAVRTKPILDSLEASAVSIAATSRNIEALTRSQKGLINTLLKDTSLTVDLRSTLENIEQGTYKFDENMEALQYSWPFRKFFRQRTKKDKKSP